MLAQDGIDELGLAARELADEGQQDAVGAQLLQRGGQALVDGVADADTEVLLRNLADAVATRNAL